MEETHKGWELVSGVRQDIITLFKLFCDTNSLRYLEFSKAWNLLKFSTIFNCRTNYNERLEFIEEVFQITKSFLLSVYEFHTRVGALYLLFGLYFKQPLKNFVKIRFTISEWKEFQSLIELCKTEKHYDAAFIYLKLYLSEAFTFVVTTRTAGLERGYRKYYKKKYNYIHKEDNIGFLYRPVLSNKLVTTLVHLENLYCKKKSQLLGKRNIDFIDTNFATSLQKILKKYEDDHLNLSMTEYLDKSKKKKPDESKIKEDINHQSEANTSVKSKQNFVESVQENQKEVTRKLSGTFLRAKKKAEFYIQQLQSDKKEQKKINLPKLEFTLPNLDEI